MKVICPNLTDNDGMIKEEYTCDGINVSPEIQWKDLPEGTKSLAVFVHDPDAPDPKAPKMDWIHWIIINIPANERGISKGGPIPEGSEEVTNDFGKKNYGGPCPPTGAHRYYFEVYALNVERLEDVTKENFKQKIKESIIEKAEVMAKYERK